MTRPTSLLLAAIAVIAAIAVLLSACSDDDAPEDAFTLGMMLDFTGGLAEYGNEMRKGFDLAVKHINAAGGVWGQDVAVFTADSGLDPTTAVEEARRLIEIEQINAFVCCAASAITLAVSELTIGAQLPTMSPSATSPQLTLVEDDDFLFRSTLSDAAQGPVLAELTAERGYDNIGLIFRNDAWGQGLAAAFASAWRGEIVSIAIDPAQTTFLAELQQSTANGAQALVVVTFVPEAEIMLREAIENGYYDEFIFSNGVRSNEIVDAIGVEYLAGTYGVGPASAEDSESARAFLAAFEAEYGAPPALPYVAETYDATIALALAAQAAGPNADGAAIRDQLRRIGSAPGRSVLAGPNAIAAALDALADGEDIDYVGAATAMDWDANGDLTSGFSSIWRYDENGEIEELEIVAYSAE